MLPCPVFTQLILWNESGVSREWNFFEQANLPGAWRQRGGCPMTLLETLALLTLIVTVIHGSIDVTLKVMQYIESKQDKKDWPPQIPSRAVNLFWLSRARELTIAGQHLFYFHYTRFGRVVKGFGLILRCAKQRWSVPSAGLALSVIASRCHLSQSERPWRSAKNRGASCVTPNFHRLFARFHWQRTLTCGIL